MKKSVFLEKYPTYSLELEKNEVSLNSVHEIVEHLESKIGEHKVAKHIATFDQYENTKSLGGEINPNIKAGYSIIFCFGSQLPSPHVLAAKPRAIGVCETEDKYFVEFLEAPRDEMNNTMEAWAKSIKR